MFAYITTSEKCYWHSIFRSSRRAKSKPELRQYGPCAKNTCTGAIVQFRHQWKAGAHRSTTFYEKAILCVPFHFPTRVVSLRPIYRP